METRFYGSIAGAEIVPPSEPDLEDVHQAYISMAASGFVTEDQRSIFHAVSHRLIEDQGAEAIILGGTDLALAFNEETAEFPLVDCAGIHADAIAHWRSVEELRPEPSVLVSHNRFRKRTDRQHAGREVA